MIEAALRYLGTRDHGVLVELLEHAIQRPGSATGAALKALTEPTAVLESWTPSERAQALWQLIQEGVHDPDVGRTQLSRPRRALRAALRIPDQDIGHPWGSSLAQRFKQLKALKDVFGEPTSTQPMEMAWKQGVRALASHLASRFDELRTPADWERYRPEAHELPPWHLNVLDRAGASFRPPSKGAQPIFADLFVTTVFMRRHESTESSTTSRGGSPAGRPTGPMCRSGPCGVAELSS